MAKEFRDVKNVNTTLKQKKLKSSDKPFTDALRV